MEEKLAAMAEKSAVKEAYVARSIGAFDAAAMTLGNMISLNLARDFNLPLMSTGNIASGTFRLYGAAQRMGGPSHFRPGSARSRRESP